MKLYLSFFTILLFACNSENTSQVFEDTEKPKLDFLILDDNCRDKFNEIFLQFTLNEITYQFDSVYYLNPFNFNDFYSESDLESFVLLKFLNEEAELNIAIQDLFDNLDYHKMYFCYYHREKIYIDEGSYFNCNVSFLNECGVKISERTSQDSALLHINLRDSRLENTWIVDSCYGEKRMNQIFFSEKKLIIDDTLELNYSQIGNELNLSDTSNFNLIKIALSSEKLILEDRKTGGASTYYYVKN